MKEVKLLKITAAFFFVACIVLSVYIFWNRRANKPHVAADIHYPLLVHMHKDEARVSIVNFQPLRAQIKDYLAYTGLAHSFYFEYLPTGTSVRDGDQNQLVGASLMKIPIVMDLYKAVERDKARLDQQVTVPQTVLGSEDQEFGNVRKLKAGDQLKLEEAAMIALKESDNTAAYTVFEHTKDLLPSEDQALIWT